uniref:Uncharacterized protein AlNc14C1G180 n=1 Tax=Albugo laibachii Nc14 TaxID=890382 RepID=F0VZ39_9STRA|nr:conserved hypothetical protein [Albugo laibachii Nc14]|eukprot:CCA14054.1 conserved hypothetical protein [Albugo laibachii Nc14]
MKFSTAVLFDSEDEDDISGPTSADKAHVMDFFAQCCEEANQSIQALTVEDISEKLAQAIALMQNGLRSVQANVSEITSDESKMQSICSQIQSTEQNEEVFVKSRPSLAASDTTRDTTVDTIDGTREQELVTMTSNLRNAMLFTGHMCSVMEDALSTITEDEILLAGQLSLNIAQRLLEAGQSLFESLRDQERTSDTGKDKRFEVISESSGSKIQANTTLVKQTRPIRSYIEEQYQGTRLLIDKHPFLAGSLMTACIPLVGFAIPIASLAGLAVALEAYYPELAAVVMELYSNSVQMMKLCILFLRISARQLGVVAKECYSSLYNHISDNGIVATGFELVSTCGQLGWMSISYLCQSASQRVR